MTEDQQKAIEKQMNNMKDKVEKIISNPTLLVIGIIIIFIFFFFTYIFINLRKRSYNCNVINNNISQTKIKPITELTDYNTILKNKTIKELFIKTAYNCCCTGNLKNDYVDKCALYNCAKYGVRALDFQIYSLNDKPIISASSLPMGSDSFKYKELYNSLSFGETMTDVKRIFLNDQNQCNNTNDPLFLIFRLYTNKRSAMDEMYDILIQIFDNSNYLYYRPNSALDDISLNEIMGKVVIIVDGGSSSNYSSSKLNKISALNLGTQINKIYRETDIIDEIANTNLNDTSSGTNIFKTNLNLLYPDLNGNVNNYDSITSGINLGVQFIAMNYQLNDEYLIQFENVFTDRKTTDKTSTSMILKENAVF